VIKTRVAAKTAELIWQLNGKLRGWANYYRHAVAKETFNSVDDQVYRSLAAWSKRRHPNKSADWRQRRYYRAIGRRQWVFFAKSRDGSGQATVLDLFQASSVPITRHIKIKARATPYDPAYADYFARREHSRRVSRQTGRGTRAFA